MTAASLAPLLRDLTADASIARITIHHGHELAEWMEAKPARQDSSSERASIPNRPDAETGRAASPFLTIDDVARRLHKSRRWLQDWLRNHPFDRNGEPFYTPLGRTKTFDERDIQRIRATLKEEEQCRLNSFHRGRGGRRTIASGAPTSESTLTEARRLANERLPTRCSKNGSEK